MTSTQLPTPHDAVEHVLSVIRDFTPAATMAARYDMARTSILASIVSDAQDNLGRRVRYYADQLDRVDMLVARWTVAGDAAELCDRVDHFDRFPDGYATGPDGRVLPDLAAIDAHIWAHMPHNLEV